MVDAKNNATWLTDQILTVRNLYTAAECESLIALAENDHGFEAASVRTQSGPRMRPDIRNNERVTLTSPEIADVMWHRIQTVIPPRDGATAIGVDSQLRFYKYSGSQRFKRHKDGVATSSEGATSKYSYLLYLNDDFSGGDTIFTFVERVNGKRNDRTLTVRPETGMALLFVHDQWHEGVPVSKGVKYVLRTDVFFQTQPENAA